MKLRAAFAALMFAFVAPASARTPIVPETTTLSEVEPALFVARDADSTLYLFGTVHLRRPGSQWGGANARAALTEADEVWTEIELNDDAKARAQVLLLQQGMAPSDQPLSSVLTAQEYQRLDQLAQRYGAPVAMFNGMRPWLAAITLSILPMIHAGYDPLAGVDEAIDAYAIEQGKTRRFFETIEQQVGFLANLEPDVQHQMLVDAINEAAKGDQEIDGLQNAWETGDLAAMEEAVVNDMRAQYPAVYDVMFVQRNNAWMQVLTRELNGSGVDFVAVGTGHLLGEHGLVEQLRARGVTVERVSPVGSAAR